jgi:cell division control protein 12
MINTLFASEICAPRNYRQRYVSWRELGIAKLIARHAKQLDKTTEIEILKADLEERGFNIKVSSSPLAVKDRAHE